jgi:hypothetical protein
MARGAIRLSDRRPGRWPGRPPPPRPASPRAPYLVRTVHHVEGVVRVEDQLSFDVDDYDPAIAFPWMGP